MSEAHEYDAALSFAGEDREVARVIASIAEANGLRVFVDENHLWQAWGKNLNEYLGEIYDRKSRYCVILISEEYCRKAYTNLERRRALDRALESKSEYILPVRLDDSWLDGLPRATAYLDLREMSAAEVGKILVRKLKGGDAPVEVPEGADAPKVVPLDQSEELSGGLRRPPRPDQPVDFIVVKVAEECQTWAPAEASGREAEGPTFYGAYEDPIFDITIMSRVERPVVLTTLGLQAVKLSPEGIQPIFGGGWEVAPVNLHRTYKLQLPDLWKAMAEKKRALDGEWDGAVNVDERASCRLPDPIFIEGYRPYRFALHLFDYIRFCPTDVHLFFWAGTDRGEAHSEVTRLRYTIMSEIQPLRRYKRLLYGEAEVKRQQEADYGHLTRFSSALEPELRTIAYELWERAGRPAGRDVEFWERAKEELPSRVLSMRDLWGVHKRPL